MRAPIAGTHIQKQLENSVITLPLREKEKNMYQNELKKMSKQTVKQNYKQQRPGTTTQQTEHTPCTSLNFHPAALNASWDVVRRAGDTWLWWNRCHSQLQMMQAWNVWRRRTTVTPIGTQVRDELGRHCGHHDPAVVAGRQLRSQERERGAGKITGNKPFQQIRYKRLI